MKFFIGIDGGGSGTRAVVVNDVLQVVGRGQSGAGNHYVVGAPQAAANCREAATAALSDACRLEPQLQASDIAAWGIGLAGVRREKDAAKMRQHLALELGAVSLVLDHDAAAAHFGAFGGDSGIILTAGTGAMCFGVDAHGERFFADGWGPLLGDEGSGYWIGQQALRAVCRASDGRGPSTRLTAPLLSVLNVPDVDALVRLVYAPDFSREQVAKLAQTVFDAAENGSQVAVEIRARAAAHLGSAIASVAHAMLLRDRERSAPQPPSQIELPVSLRGGLMNDDYFRAAVGYEIGERLVELKRDYWPISSWKIVKPQFEAAVGAALLAQRKFGITS